MDGLDGPTQLFPSLVNPKAFLFGRGMGVESIDAPQNHLGAPRRLLCPLRPTRGSVRSAVARPRRLSPGDESPDGSGFAAEAAASLAQPTPRPPRGAMGDTPQRVSELFTVGGPAQSIPHLGIDSSSNGKPPLLEEHVRYKYMYLIEVHPRPDEGKTPK